MKSLLVTVFLWTLVAANIAPVAAQGTTVLNVEIDYMVETGPGAHSHRPSQDEIDAVIRMFACQGVTLNVVIDDALPHFDVLRRDPLFGDLFEYSNGLDTFGGIKSLLFNRGDGWHYAVFGHQYEDEEYDVTNSSGLGERPGDDFVVTLGAFDNEIGTAWDRAATFAHEFGHNLGLRHTGASEIGGNNMPNLTSVMSYFFQLTGVRSALQCNGLIGASDSETLYKELDYSHGRACTLVELGLLEDRGMGVVPVDWNCNGALSDIVVQDLNSNNDGTPAFWCGSTGPLQALSDYDEWSNLVDVTMMPEVSYVSEEVSCVSADEIAAYRSRLEERGGGGCLQPTPSLEACTLRRMNYLSSGGGVQVGTCQVPFASVEAVKALSGDGDILYVQPGSYSTSGIIFSDPLQILGPGGAVIGN